MTAMTLERAHEIVAACTRNALYRLAVGVDADLPKLEAYSLRDMLDANHLVAAENAKPGAGRVVAVCDDRLVAALYALHHYEASPIDEAMPIAACPDKSLVVVEYELEEEEE